MADSNYVKSGKIKVYPTAYRGTKNDNGVVVNYNPESKLNTEENRTRPYLDIISYKHNNRSNNTGNYVITENYVFDPSLGPVINTPFEFIIHGYYFKLLDADTFFNSMLSTSDSQLWAHIEIEEKGSSSDPNNTSIMALGLKDLDDPVNKTNLDRTSDGEDYFYGLAFAKSKPATPPSNSYWFKILEKNSTSGIFEIPTESKFIIYSENICTNKSSKTNLNEYLQTKDLTVNHTIIFEDLKSIGDNKVLTIDFDGVVDSQDFTLGYNNCKFGFCKIDNILTNLPADYKLIDVISTSANSDGGKLIVKTDTIKPKFSTSLSSGTEYSLLGTTLTGTPSTNPVYFNEFYSTINSVSNRISFNLNGRIKANSFYAASDKRLKENITPFEYKKSILDLPIYKYDYINGQKNNIGCMAQDLQELYPELVTEDSEGYLSVDNSKVVYLLLEEVKLLKKEIEELKKK